MLVASILVFLISSKFIALRFFSYIVITQVLDILLKQLSGKAFPGRAGIYRPPGAGNCMGCGIFPDCDGCVNVDDQIGMPSGHSMAMAMAATFWSWWIFNASGTLLFKSVRSSLLILFALAVIISRTPVVENCHTYLQVIVGSLLGVALGTGFYFLEIQLFNE
uniref:PAP2 superfamily protein n=1 Tax=Marseillevirus LCMAC202 TaxID=2506606 RepID=A0A481YYH2_9VIRU|nr:MAG: PAP2 superfamily protein [Marseillevirus LCMAC202]